MRTYWIVVADAGRAVVLCKAFGGGPPHVVKTLEHPSSRLHTSEIVTDHRGRIDRGNTQSAAEPRTDPHEEKAVEFAREVSRMLDAAAGRHEFDALILVAPAHFLGLLNARLGPVATKRLAMSQTKDLTHASLPDLERYVSELVRTPGLVVNA